MYCIFCFNLTNKIKKFLLNKDLVNNKAIIVNNKATNILCTSSYYFTNNIRVEKHITGSCLYYVSFVSRQI